MIMQPDDFTKEQKQAAWDYYEPLTLHDSSLSYGVHSVLASNLGDLEHAEEYFNKSLFLDIENVMDNTGKEGLHFAAFGITWQAVIRGFAGLTTGNGRIEAYPALPLRWKKLRFHYQYQGVNYCVEIQDNQAVITAQPRS
jgi:trehalose/maltose hydrolase-like predicted phosphorylase